MIYCLSLLNNTEHKELSKNNRILNRNRNIGKKKSQLDYFPKSFSPIMKSSEKQVLAHLKHITGPLLDPLQFAYQANRCMDDAVNMGLHYILQNLGKPGILFVDSLQHHHLRYPPVLTKLTQLSVPTSIC